MPPPQAAHGEIMFDNELLEGEYNALRLPKDVQLKRIKKIMDNELTEIQRETILNCVILGKHQSEYAKERGVSKSTISRNLRRAIENLQKYLRY